jgi:hypothetical protein
MLCGTNWTPVEQSQIDALHAAEHSNRFIAQQIAVPQIVLTNMCRILINMRRTHIIDVHVNFTAEPAVQSPEKRRADLSAMKISREIFNFRLIFCALFIEIPTRKTQLCFLYLD